MHHIMFDIDGTLVQSCDFDEHCYIAAIKEVTGHTLNGDWSTYPQVTDSGVLLHFLQQIGLQDKFTEIHQQVKTLFTEKIADHLQQTPLTEVPGAATFINYLRDQQQVRLSLATGGWNETARLKLAAAGIDITGIPLASSNDHYARTEIMQLALQQACENRTPSSLSYFGDGEWDRRACSELNFNFILVGNRTCHHQQISDFSDLQQALTFLPL
ncbi:HAD family hydrolase [Aliamphritea ceti]|uniref:HAD family hydrolase n=1 Tax=Aliamphritea ceti TaxID=1524258 RepID=UPI0021C3A6B7|nr:HAD family hydrolase [Aliamphritea ceti]